MYKCLCVRKTNNSYSKHPIFRVWKFFVKALLFNVVKSIKICNFNFQKHLIILILFCYLKSVTQCKVKENIGLYRYEIQ